LEVLEKNPPKQGLKPKKVKFLPVSSSVLEKNPPKQGLKHPYDDSGDVDDLSFREKSTKTRIETL